MLCSLNLGSIRRFLTSLYHKAGPGRKPYNPVSMLKAQLLKHLLRVPSDRRLALLLKRNRKMAEACGFRRRTPSHGLFTQFRHRLGKDGGKRVFSMLLKQLLKDGAVEGSVVALDSTAIKAYSQRSLDNKTGRSDREARVGRGRRGFLLGYKVHTACCTSSELPLAFTLQPCNFNDKRFVKPLLEKLKRQCVAFKAVVADAQYDSSRVRETVREYDAEPVIPYPANQKKGVKGVLRVDKKFRVHGPERLRRLYRLKSSVERVNSRLSALLSRITLKGLKAAATQVSYAIIGMLFIAWTALKTGRPEKARSITYYV